MKNKDRQKEHHQLKLTRSMMINAILDGIPEQKKDVSGNIDEIHTRL